jgi:hypothetical protein
MKKILLLSLVVSPFLFTYKNQSASTMTAGADPLETEQGTKNASAIEGIAVMVAVLVLTIVLLTARNPKTTERLIYDL